MKSYGNTNMILHKNLQLFYLKNLVVNVTKHVLVPKHIKISKEEEDVILKRFNIKKKNELPIIKSDDAICQYYNFKSGDIIKILRSNELSGSGLFIRLVK